ncbi:MAG: cysteine methyltransferase, partial [Dokdonella sp.]
MYYDLIETPIGPLLVVGDADGALVQLDLPKASRPTQIDDGWKRDPKRLTKVRRQIEAYFAGDLTEFVLSLRPHGTDF